VETARAAELKERKCKQQTDIFDFRKYGRKRTLPLLRHALPSRNFVKNKLSVLTRFDQVTMIQLDVFFRRATRATGE
jgi:hypothetical protein